MYCIYHSRDLDGFTSGAIIKQAFKEQNRDITLIGYDYGQPFPYEKIQPGKPVVMVDVSLDSMALMHDLARYTNHQLTWIDHHISAINSYKDYLAGMPDTTHFMEAVLNNGLAACEIAYQYYFPNRPLPEAVQLLGQYDTWRHADADYWQTDILPFQYGMRLACTSPETFPLNILKDGAFVRDTIRDGYNILKYQKQQDAFAARGAFQIEFMGYQAICINGGGFNSQAFESVYDESKHDLMMPFKFDGTKWIFSLYTTKDIDCSLLAKKMFGGGHKKAAGFQVSDFPWFVFDQVTSSILDIVRNLGNPAYGQSTATTMHIDDLRNIWFDKLRMPQ